MTTAVLITNKASGSHLDGTEKSLLVRGWLEDCGLEVTVLDGPVASQIEESRNSTADVVVVDGGDGTINAAITAHVGSGRPIGLIPGGTMNLLAADYGVPLDREAAARFICHLNVRSFDAGFLGERVFLHTALTGLPARLGVHRENRRGRLTLIDRLALGLHALGTVGRDPRLRLEPQDAEAGGAALTSRTFAFVVGALRGTILPRPHREVDQSGALTALSIDANSGLELVRLALRGAIGDLADDPLVTRTSLRGGVLSGARRSTHAMLDGESVRLSLPAQLGIMPGAVHVIVPPPEKAW